MKNILLTIIKTIFSILLLPSLAACAIVFKKQLLYYPQSYQFFLLSGTGAYLIFFLFLISLEKIFEFGQKIITTLLKFTAPFDVFFANIFSIYLIVTLGLFYFLNAGQKINDHNHILMFFVGFFFSLHIISLAQSLKGDLKIFSRLSYLFWIVLAFIANIFLIVFVADKVLGQGLFQRFAVSCLEVSKQVYKIVFQTLFLWK
ncbi:MAG TPA: hypothetical protein PLH56_04960 [Candidatus Omnitrophota bacterium]|nr:hypothetical protein [Candidatus Omnitrophota bacterium]